MVMYPSDWATYTFDEMFQLYPNNTLSRDKLSNQEAIADVLTEMDDEIKALEDERDKMIQIREGAMDDLLTGRVRLGA